MPNENAQPPTSPMHGLVRLPAPIVAAAVWHCGVVYEGKRHGEAIQRAYAITGTTVRGTQGFVDSNGDFFSRAEAVERAKETGQIPQDFAGQILMSEDLW